jgi:hypothetical protein
MLTHSSVFPTECWVNAKYASHSPVISRRPSSIWASSPISCRVSAHKASVSSIAQCRGSSWACHDGLAGAYVNVVEQGLVAIPVAIIYSVRDLANRRLYPLGMAPILQESLIVTDPLADPTHYHVSNELRGAIGANGAQGFALSDMAQVTLPWKGINERTLSTARCINVNRTPFISLDDPLIRIHNDWKEPESFRAAVGISLLKRANT